MDQSAGSYREFTAALYDLTHTHTGLHPDLIPELVDRATVRMRQGSASVQSPEEFVRLYVEALSGIEVAAHGKKGTVSFGPAARDEMVRTMLDDQRLRFTP